MRSSHHADTPVTHHVDKPDAARPRHAQSGLTALGSGLGLRLATAALAALALWFVIFWALR